MYSAFHPNLVHKNSILLGPCSTLTRLSKSLVLEHEFNFIF
jgi:hypothetical protein